MLISNTCNKQDSLSGLVVKEVSYTKMHTHAYTHIMHISGYPFGGFFETQQLAQI